MSHKVLLVDDEVNLLQSLRRSFRNRYELLLAEGGESALGILNSEPSLAVVVSDMQMPNVNGLKVLSEAKRLCPNTVRIMLTGNIDQQTAVDAVNQGGVFRFVNKPCDPEALASVIDEAIQHHEQLIAEKVLLSRTLTAAVGVSTELLALANPKAHGRANRLKDLAKKIADRLSLADRWQLEVSAMLSQIGCVNEAQAMESPAGGNGSGIGGNVKPPIPFSPDWDRMLASQAEASSQIVSKIPRLDRVSTIIRMQVTDVPTNSPLAIDLQFALILRMLIEFDYLSQSTTIAAALEQMQQHANRYEPQAFQQLLHLAAVSCTVTEHSVRDLQPGMMLEDHVLNDSGDILISKGHELTETLIQRLRNFSRSTIGVREPIKVRCPK